MLLDPLAYRLLIVEHLERATTEGERVAGDIALRMLERAYPWIKTPPLDIEDKEALFS